MKHDGLGELETCSLCTEEVRWTSLRETDAGNVCRSCYFDLKG
jgi:formylmethanofuran dehydrogenase subunit E